MADSIGTSSSGPTFTNGQATNLGVAQGNAVVNPVSSNYFSALRTRSIVEPEYIYNEFPKIDSVPKNLEIDYSKILHKPYFVKNIKWSTGDPAYTFLDYTEVPFDIIVNELTKYPFNTSVMFRAKVSLIYQVSATPMHQGTVLIGAVPSGVYAALNSTLSTPARVNKLMVAPHGFLYANESTAVRIQVPFYNNAKLVNTDIMSDTVHPNRIRSEYADVVVMVLNSLAQPTSAAETVTISVHAVFDELEFFVPHIDTTFVPQGLAEIGTKAVNGIFGVARNAVGGLCDLGKLATGDFLDYVRGAFKKYTGLHNPNFPMVTQKDIVTTRQNLNQVDVPTYFEKLDPYGDYSRITKDYLFDTSVDEMSMSHLLSKPMFVSTFTVKSTTAAGTPVFARPITPFQQTPILSNALDFEGDQTKSPSYCDLHTMFYHLSKYWRGGLSVHIQSNMTNFHFCKLLVARNYSPVEGMALGYPKYEEIQNLMVETLEFSGGGQVQTVDMPYISSLDFLPTTTSMDFNAFIHGMYYIYLAQPLVSNGSVPVDIQFNVYISMNKDFQYYGYSNNLLQVFGFGDETPVREFEAEASIMQPIEDQSSLNNPGGVDHDKYKDEFLRPIVSVRDYSRRMYRAFRARVRYDDAVARNGVFAISVSSLLKPPLTQGSPGNYQRAYCHPLAVLRRTFLGYNGGLKVKAVLSGTSVGMLWYSPPSYVRSSDGLATTWLGAEPLAYAGGAALTAGEKLYGLDNGEPLASNYSGVLPTVERPNYAVSASGASSHRGDEENVLMGGCILEGHVPNLSPYRFLGDGATMDISTINSLDSPFEQMGHLIITVPKDPSLLGPGAGNSKCSLEIAIWIGADDEGRFGFQSILPFFGLTTKRDISIVNDNDPITGLPSPALTYNGYLYLN